MTTHTETAERPARLPFDQPQTWYFTFGYAHAHPQGYFVVENATSEAARDRMIEVFGREWAFQYDAHDWFKRGHSQADEYGLREVK